MFQARNSSHVPAIVTLLVAVGMALGLFAGCGEEDGGSSSDSSNGAASAPINDSANAGSGTNGGVSGTNGESRDETDDTGDDADAVETSSLTKAEFDQRAEEICIQNGKNALPEIVTYITREASSSGKGEAELAAEAVQKFFLPKVQAQIDEIRALGAPAGDEQQVEEFLAAMQQGVEALQDRDQLTLRTDVDATFQRTGKLMHAYGLQSCL